MTTCYISFGAAILLVSRHPMTWSELLCPAADAPTTGKLEIAK